MVLAGDTGVGKTTMALVCARTAGYEPHVLHLNEEEKMENIMERVKSATSN